MLALLTVVAVPTRAAQQRERVLRESVARLEHAWNASNAELWAAEYWPDGELINILGVVLPNAVEVRARTAQILAGPFSGSRFASVVRNVRFLGADAAMVDIDIRVTNFRALPPGTVATEPGVLLTRMKHVFERRHGRWRIVASQNTAVLPKEAATR